MDVVIGPVPAESMAAFARFARHVLQAEGPGADVPSDAASSFEGYIGEWEARSGEEGDITWAASADPEVVEYLVYAFFRVAREVRDEAGDVDVVPPEASAFYWLLVGALLDALTEEGGSRAEFAAHLREFWPGDHEIP